MPTPVGRLRRWFGFGFHFRIGSLFTFTLRSLFLRTFLLACLIRVVTGEVDEFGPLMPAVACHPKGTVVMMNSTDSKAPSTEGL